MGNYDEDVGGRIRVLKVFVVTNVIWREGAI